MLYRKLFKREKPSDIELPRVHFRSQILPFASYSATQNRNSQPNTPSQPERSSFRKRERNSPRKKHVKETLLPREKDRRAGGGWWWGVGGCGGTTNIKTTTKRPLPVCLFLWSVLAVIECRHTLKKKKKRKEKRDKSSQKQTKQGAMQPTFKQNKQNKTKQTNKLGTFKLVHPPA